MNMADQQLVEFIRKSQEAGAPEANIRQDLVSAGWDSGQIEKAFQAVNPSKIAVPVPKPVLHPPITPLETGKPETAGESKPVHKRQIYTSVYSAFLALVLLVSLLILAHNATVDVLNKFAPLADQGDREFYRSVEYKAYEANREPAPPYPNYSQLEDYALTTTNYERKLSEWRTKDQALLNKYRTEYQQKRSNPVSPSFRLILHAGLVLPLWVVSFLLTLNLKEERKRYQSLLVPYYLTSGWLLIYLFFNVAKYIYTANTVLGVYVVLGMLAVILTGAIWGIQKYRHSQQN